MSEDTDLFARLGGTRAIAETLNEAPSTVQSWKSARRIPAHKQTVFIERYAAVGVEISADDMVWPFGRPLPASPESEAA